MKAFRVLGSRFDLPDTYDVIEAVGSGAYGVVIAARDKTEADTSSNLVAIKKIEKAFEHKVFALRTLRELKIMRLLDHDNILSVKSILKPESLESFDQIYVVTELMETDLS
jgi:serine/threonine protein kinase